MKHPASDRHQLRQWRPGVFACLHPSCSVGRLDGANEDGDGNPDGPVGVKEASSADRRGVDRAVDITVDNFVDYAAGQPQLVPRRREHGDRAKAAAFRLRRQAGPVSRETIAGLES